MDSLDLARLRKQDAGEFARLVDCFTPVLSGLCQAMGLRGANIDDALAEALASVYLALPKFEGRSELATWVHCIAVRTIVKVRTRYQTRGSSGDTPDEPDTSPGPAEHAEKSETDQRVWNAVAKLEPRQAAAVELFYRRGWSVEEIARVLECPANTVKTLLSRARERLRGLLSKEAPEQESSRSIRMEVLL